MGIYLILGILLALVSGVLTKSVLKAQKKLTDTFTFMGVGIVLGIILVLLRNGLGVWYVETSANVSIAIIAYFYTYRSFYKDFKGKFPKSNIGFLRFINLKASQGKVTIQDVSTEDIISDAFAPDVVREFNDDLNTHKGAFWGWGAILLNGLIFIGFVISVAAQSTLGNFFSDWLNAIMSNKEFMVVFWIFMGLVGIVLLGKLFGLDKD